MGPVRSEHHAPGQPIDVEAIFARVHVDPFLLTRQQIEEQRSETVGPEELRDDAVARAEPAAAAAVREHHEPGGVLGHSQVGFDLALAHRNRDRFSNGGGAHGSSCQALGCGLQAPGRPGAHSLEAQSLEPRALLYTPDGYVSGGSAAASGSAAAGHFSSGSSAWVSSMCMTASNCLGS